MEEKQYNDNKNITLRVKPVVTPPPPTEQQLLEEWVRNNRPFFFNHGRKERKDLEKVYQLYNIIYDANRKIIKTGCGGCHRHIIDTIKKKYYG
jgi:hypothetical protein